MLYLKYTLSLVYFMVSQGAAEAQAPAAEIPYYVQIHFQVILEAGFPSPEPNPRRTSLAEEGGGNPETRSLRGVFPS